MQLYRKAIYNSRSLRSITLGQCRCQYKFSSQSSTLFNYSEIDLGCSQAAIQQPLNIATPDILTKLSYFSPSSIHDTLDVFSRDLFLYLSDDLNLGMGTGIIIISLGIKVIFAPVLFMSQLNALKMKLLEPETKNFQASYQKLTQARDLQGSKALSQNYRELRQKHNISMIQPLLSLFQIPLLMTWFFSLRYLTSLPDQYPGLKTDGFLWFRDLTQYDPYGILPLISATLSFWNISINPSMAAGTSHPLGRYYRYIRFLPFVSIPIAVFFPAGVNLYWCSSALVQLLITAATRSAFFGIPQYLPGTILEKLHQGKTQNIIHAVINQSISQRVSLDEGRLQEKLEGNGVNNKPIQQSVQNGLQQKGSVKLFSNKPKKVQK